MKVIISNKSKIGIGHVVVDNRNKITKINFSKIAKVGAVGLKDLYDVDRSTQQNGDVLAYNANTNSYYFESLPVSENSASIFVSDIPPINPRSNKDLWWQSNTGSLKIYYSDPNSSQWVDVMSGGEINNQVEIIATSMLDGGTPTTSFSSGPVFDCGGTV